MYFLLVSVLVPGNILLSFDSVFTVKRPVFVTSVLVFLVPYIKLVYLAFSMVFLFFFVCFYFLFFIFILLYFIGWGHRPTSFTSFLLISCEMLLR